MITVEGCNQGGGEANESSMGLLRADWLLDCNSRPSDPLSTTQPSATIDGFRVSKAIAERRWGYQACPGDHVCELANLCSNSTVLPSGVKLFKFVLDIQGLLGLGCWRNVVDGFANLIESFRHVHWQCRLIKTDMLLDFSLIKTSTLGAGSCTPLHVEMHESLAWLMCCAQTLEGWWLCLCWHRLVIQIS